MIVYKRNLNYFKIRFLFTSDLEVLFDNLLEEPAHVVCDSPDGFASKAFGDVLSGTWPVRVDADRMNMLKKGVDVPTCKRTCVDHSPTL